MEAFDPNGLDYDDELLSHITGEPNQALIDIDRELVKRGGLRAFLELAWPTVEGDGSFSSNWHIDAICEHLQAVSRGEIKRLAIAVPPRHCKSICVAVMWPAFDWLDNPSRRLLFASYAHNLSMRDSTRCRRVIASPWYQARWGERFKLTSDQNTKVKFETDKGGYRMSTSVGGQLTGEGGDFVCFPADQRILTEHGPRAIGDIVASGAAIRVWSYDTTSGRVALKPVRGWHTNPGRAIVRVTLSDGCSFRCTADHRIWTRSGWVEAAALGAGDVLPGPPLSHSGDRAFVDGVPPCDSFQRVLAPEYVDDVFRLELGGVVALSAGPIIGETHPFGHISPASAAPDVSDSTGSHTKRGGQLMDSFGTRRDVLGLCIGQFGSMAPLSDLDRAVPQRVSGILPTSAVCEVGRDVVRAVPVQVAHVLAGRARSDEGCCDADMDVAVPPLAVRTPRSEAEIPVLIGLQHKHAAFDRHGVGVGADEDSRLASDPAEAGDGIGALQAGDRTPLFVEFDHAAEETFCLDVADYHTMMLPGQVIAHNCVDDAHNVSQAESEAVREGTLTWWDEAMSTRLNRPREGAFVLIQQRVHSRDLMGHVLKKSGQDYTMLCLPAEFEPDHPQRWFRDPRKEAGELLWPEHIPRKTLEEMKNKLGNYAAAAQLQQRPTAREGGLFKRAWMTIKNDIPKGRIQWSRAWDLAASEKKLVKSDPDWTATALVGFSATEKKWVIAEVKRWRVEPNRVRELVREHAEKDAFGTPGKQTTQSIPIDPGQAGKDQAQQYALLLAGWPVQLEPQTGNKVTRSMGLAAQCAAGNVLMLEGDWNDTFLAELTGFPNSDHDDQVDAASSAFNRLTGGNNGILDYYQRLADDAEAAKKPPTPNISGYLKRIETTQDLGRAFLPTPPD